jgi:hypothetical protein
MKCVILQPSYIPWRGVFDQIRQADVFVFYDDVQYDKHGWRNRNQLKTPQGKQWLTIPVSAKGAVTDHVPINEVPIIWNKAWNKEHLKTLRQHYGKAPHYKAYEPLLEEYYARHDTLLADFTIDFTIALARALHIEHTQFVRSSTLGVTGTKTDRLMAVLQKLGVDHYISGPSAKDYLETEKFEAAGIRLDYVKYDYPEYPQLYPPYDPAVTILDLLFMTGDQALKYITGTP